MKVRVLGFVWYRRDQYGRVREVMEDGHRLPPTFEEWEKRSLFGERETRRRGLGVVRVDLDLDVFARWCSVNFLKLDSQARMLYANHIAAQRYRQSPE